MNIYIKEIRAIDFAMLSVFYFPFKNQNLLTWISSSYYIANCCCQCIWSTWKG